MVSNLNKQKIPTIRPTNVDFELNYENMSVLGRKLYDIAKEIDLSDDLAYDDEMIQKELQERRGGYDSANLND